MITSSSTLPYGVTLFSDFTVTIEKPPAGGPPLVLMNTKTVIHVGTAPVFPPQGRTLELQAPVDLAPVGAPHEVVAQILRLTMTWSHNP